ncbi:ComEA family DNA-binding protein [uncultured Enterococcus sp.]|uniref:ComEA family DNA-binding protein n=1 Tax=uncultured Enterococcus sp. TaxID=167972 RepID=UPI002AA699E3|nr:ComEA family DNA-binding protein [uncultured Enterococcus sp.]
MKIRKKILVGLAGLSSILVMGGREAAAGNLPLPSHDMDSIFVKDGSKEYLPLDFAPSDIEYISGFNGWGADSSNFSLMEEPGNTFYTGPNNDFASVAGRTHDVYPSYGGFSENIIEENGFFIDNSEFFPVQGKVPINQTNQINIRVQNNEQYNLSSSGYDIYFNTGTLLNDKYRYFLTGEVAFVEGDSSSEYRVVTSSFSGKGSSNYIAAIAENYTNDCYKSFSIPISKQIMMYAEYGIFLGVHSENPEVATEYSYQNIRLERERVVSLNEADAQELQLLSGIGTVLAQRIVDYREEGNYFQSIDDLINIKGIGIATVNKIKEQNLAVLSYTLGNNLNGM